MRRFYWIKQGLLHSAAILGATVLYSVYIFVLESSHRYDVQRYLGMATGYLAVLTAVLPTIFSQMLHASTIPLTLSLGATRKETWVGLQLYRLAILLPVLGGMALFFILGSGVDIQLTLILMLSGYLYFNGVGCILGILSTKLSRGALAITTALISVGSLALAAVPVILTLLAREYAVVLIYILPAFGILIYGICTHFERKTIKTTCVK